MEFTNERVTVLYGSQTGNAQDVAERIWRESKRYFFVGSVKAMDDYDILNLVSEKCVIFVCSTTGQGEEPDNMKLFWKLLLRKNLPTNLLSNLRFAVLGLGDSSYLKFNFVAKRLHKRLMQLGANMLIPLGLGDEQHDLGYDATVDPWTDSLYDELLSLYPLPKSMIPLNINETFKPRWSVSSLTTDCATTYISHSPSMYYSTRTPQEFMVTVKEVIRTTAETHFQDVRLIKLQTQGQMYRPGDVVVIRPRNSASQIEQFQNILKSHNIDIQLKTIFKITEASPEMPVPPPLQYEVTFQQLCEQYFDLNAIPRRYCFNILLNLTDSEVEREKLSEFISAEGQNDLYNYCNRPRRNIVEVLQDFPHALKNVTKEILFEIFPPIKPREFSIASSFKAHTNEIHILLAIVRYKTKLVKERFGLCSNYLARLQVDDRLQVWIKTGSFKFPNDANTPVILVGPGTGMAPFRSFINERVVENRANANSLVFFFGCRGNLTDYHCKEEFIRFENEKKITLICAFSRDFESKVYVQHKIEEEGCLVWNLLKAKNAYIFIAGNAKNMPQQVREAFINVCRVNGQITMDDAVRFIENMEKSGQYQTETW